MDSNPKPRGSKAASLNTKLPEPCLTQFPAFDEEEAAAGDYWSSPLGQAALADDWDEDEV